MTNKGFKTKLQATILTTGIFFMSMGALTHPSPKVHASSLSETAAKQFIANRESGCNYRASNGLYYGKYQLSKSYLHGDYSAKNQERVANKYVHSHYGSWANAMRHWLANHWY